MLHPCGAWIWAYAHGPRVVGKWLCAENRSAKTDFVRDDVYKGPHTQIDNSGRGRHERHMNDWNKQIIAEFRENDGKVGGNLRRAAAVAA